MAVEAVRAIWHADGLALLLLRPLVLLRSLVLLRPLVLLRSLVLLRPLVLLCSLVLLRPLAQAQTPDLELRKAVADIGQFSAADAPFIRYASLYNLPEKDRVDAAAAVSFVLNMVSRSSVVRVPTKIGDTLVRFDLRHYKLPVEAYESLVVDEPYWHIRTQVLVQGKPTTVLTDGGWVDLKAAALLRKSSGSGGALSRADWLVARMSSAPLYYILAGVPPNKKELLKVLGIDAESVLRLQATRGDNVLKSGVTRYPRRISRWPTPLGAQYITYDSDGRNPAADPIRDPSFSVQSEASELIASKPNGFHLFVLLNGSGERQDAVPDRIAKDHTDIHGDGRLIAGISCVRCHGPVGGLHPIAHDQTDLLKKGKRLISQDRNEIESLEAFYDAEQFDKLLERDKQDYQDAVSKAVPGKTVKEISEIVAKVFDDHENMPVTPGVAARELGVETLSFLDGSTDGVLLSLSIGKPVSRNQWVASWQTAALLARQSKR